MTDDEKQLVSDFKATFTAFEPGIRVLKHLSKYCFENKSTIDNDSARNSDFNQGRREVILEIRRKLNVNLDEQKQEIKENVL